MKINFNKKKTVVYFSALAMLASGCKKELIKQPDQKSLNPGNYWSILSVTPATFNWETVDWMPTPPGQSQIPPPWIGQGSIASQYGIDVVNDHKASDGWVMLYNTFDPNASGSLVNPYFILYNRYRGLMRVYLYTTSQFISPSTYIVDGLKVVSNTGSSMLNYMGTDIIDPSQNQSSFSQIEPAPIDGSQPLASNKWYMLQYEIAYDPQIAAMSYQDIQLSWFVNFNSVSTISLGGTETGTIKSAVGAPADPLDAALKNGGTVVGKAAATFVGSQILNNVSQTGSVNNKVGLSNEVFTRIKGAVSSALSAATGNIPGAIYGIFSAIIGGTGDSTPTMNLNLNSTITLHGTQTSAGSFPSSPTSVYVPGSIITSSAQNFIPLYNQTLGVFNLIARPHVVAHKNHFPDSDGLYSTSYSLTSNMDQIMVTNPAVINTSSTGAYIRFSNEAVILLDPNLYFTGTTTSGSFETIGTHTAIAQTITDGDPDPLWTSYYAPYSQIAPTVAVRVTFQVVPNNGGPVSTFVKTFLADVETIDQY
ncbi:MAG: hypothetical protein ABI367_14325 [Mucilaginibacter sp.]